MYEYQTAVDLKNLLRGDTPVHHITAVGDTTTLCEHDDDLELELDNWSEVRSADETIKAYMDGKITPLCGKCADAFWSVHA